MVEAKGKENGTVFVAETTYGVTKFPLLHDKIEEGFTNLWKVKIFKPVERAAIRAYAVSLLLFFQRRILVAVRELIPDYKTKEEAKNQNLVSSCWLNISHTLKERSWESLSESLTFGGLLFKAARIPIANFDLLGATFFNVWTDTPQWSEHVISSTSSFLPICCPRTQRVREVRSGSSPWAQRPRAQLTAPSLLARCDARRASGGPR